MQYGILFFILEITQASRSFHILVNNILVNIAVNEATDVSALYNLYEQLIWWTLFLKLYISSH